MSSTSDVREQDRPLCAQCGIRARERRRGSGGGRGGYYTRCSVCRDETRHEKAGGARLSSDYQKQRYEDRKAGFE